MVLDLNRIAKTVEKFMIDTISIYRVITTVYNEVTMEEDNIYGVIYSGPAFVAPVSDPEATTLGGKNVEQIQYEIAIPLSSPMILPNDVVQVTASADASLVAAGRSLFIRDEIPTTFLTHRRLKAFKNQASV